MITDQTIKVLYIDLSNKSWEVKDRPDLFPYLGGVGVGIRLLDENVLYDRDPLDGEQPVIFCVGLLSSIFPVITKTVCMFRSPLTGELGESYAGGRLAMSMVYSGYDAIVIKGEAPQPTYLSIGPDGVEFRNAEPLWGVGTEETGRYLREMEPGRGYRSTVRIGPAGENLVSFANLNVDTFRHFGRLGSGAVFGSKNLKAMVVFGTQDYPIPKEQQKAYRKVYKEIHDRVTKTDVMEKYHDLGTTVNILKLNAMKGLPTRNLQSATFNQAQEISGEAFAEEKLVRKLSCSSCPIGSIHIAAHRKSFNKESHEYETSQLAYDHELVFALGSFLGTGNQEDFLSLLDEVEDLGFDVMSAGVLLGWLTEAFANQLVGEEELGTRLDFGYTEGYIHVLRRMAKPDNELYRLLGKGTEAAAEQLGGLDYACTLGRTEMTGYHTGYGAALGQAVGARHSHLDNAGYSLDQTKKGTDPAAFVSAMFEEEVSRCITNCLIMCLFARSVYDYPTIVKALSAIGVEKSEEELKELALEIFRNKIMVKQKMGFDFRKLRFPKRFFETECLNGVLKEEVMQEMLDLYIREVDRVMAGWQGPLEKRGQQIPAHAATENARSAPLS
ncbi:MAG: aldehyde ferredoxin oxidoreductase N-terminal domain-containing protein [Syntrophomonadales bacterium]|jgi:aldehyde:ferredoxin oxidoreductase